MQDMLSPGCCCDPKDPVRYYAVSAMPVLAANYGGDIDYSTTFSDYPYQKSFGAHPSYALHDARTGATPEASKWQPTIVKAAAFALYKDPESLGSQGEWEAPLRSLDSDYEPWELAAHPQEENRDSNIYNVIFDFDDWDPIVNAGEPRPFVANTTNIPQMVGVDFTQAVYIAGEQAILQHLF